MVAGALALALAVACGKGAEPPLEASTLWFARDDGTISPLLPGDAPTAVDVLPVAPEASAFETQPGAGGRQVAYDAAHQRLWYSDDHSWIHSIDLATGERGPALGPFSDVALWGCSVTGRPRTFAVDPRRDELLVSSLGGGLIAYDLDTLALVGGIGPARMGEPAFDFRRLAVDASAGTVWFSTASNELVELDLDAESATGRRVALSAPPRSVAVDDARSQLVILVGDQLVTVDLDTLAATSAAAPGGAVAVTRVSAR
jgi:hypothetical protein